MEFNNLGKNCRYCLQKDFLPFLCKYCNHYYCMNHTNTKYHQDCNKLKEKSNIKKIKFNKKKCFVCNKKDKYNYTCNKCNKDVCMIHRYEWEHKCNIKLINKSKIKKSIKKKSCLIC